MFKLKGPLAAVVALMMLLTVGMSNTFAFAMRDGGNTSVNSQWSYTTAQDDQGDDTNVDENNGGDTSAEDDQGDDTSADDDDDGDTASDTDTDGDTTADDGNDGDTSGDTGDTGDTGGSGNTGTNRGACVSAVANSADVGGNHVNHGGAVSTAAHTTCRTTDGSTTGDTGTHERMNPNKGSTDTSGDTPTTHGKSGDTHGKSGDTHGHGND